MNRTNPDTAVGKQNYNDTYITGNRFLVLKITLLLALLISLTACEKVIQLDLKNSSPKIVIQGSIYDHAGPFTITLSKSVNFDAASEYPSVSGAKVLISDNYGQSEVLSEPVPGRYVTSKLKGIPGHIYSLSVNAGKETYRASALMPHAVGMDSIYFSPSPFGGETVTVIRFNDSPYSADYYRMVYFINKVQQKEFYVLDDELLQGSTIYYALHPGASDTKLLKGDQVTVWLETVDPGVYNYFRSAGTQGGTSASPANPVSNISNGALGYFNVCAVRKLSATLNH